MKKFALLLSTLSIGQLYGQISIVSSDFAIANDTVRYSVASNIPASYEQAGANKTWNFSEIRATSQDVLRYQPVTSTPYFLQFFTATYGLPETANFPGIGGGGANANPFGYYRLNPTALVSMGKGATIQNLPLGIVYNPRDTMFKFPLEYQKVYEGSFAGSAGFAGLGSLVQTGTRRTEVDGWGTIITPFGTFDCLRVKSEVNGVDSISLGATGIPIPNSRTEYYWFGKNQDFPLMEVVINNLTQQTTIRYKDRYRPELYRSNARFTASRTKATTKDTITLNNQSLNSPTRYTWTITPSTFKYVAGTAASSASPRIQFEAEGVYSIKLEVNYLGGSDDTLRSNYISITAPTTALVEKVIEKESLNFFPNPGKDLVNFSSGLNQVSQVRIYNLLGEEVIAFSLAPQQVLPVNTSNLKSGIYFVELQANGQKISKKLRID
jgi:hypothetical protein